MKINGNPDGGGGASAVIEGLAVTSNGTYTAGEGVDGYSPVEVNVPAPEFVTETLSVSVNNTYTPGQGVDGFSQVIVDVPQSVTGFTEKEITEGIQIVNLSNSASMVHTYTFEKDEYLQTVNLPNASYIGSWAFGDCQNLTSVTASNCQYINTGAFNACSQLSYISFPNLTNANEGVFKYCSSLSYADLPEFTTPYYNGKANSMFYGCSNLSGVNMPKLEVVYKQMFGTTKISELSFPVCKKLDYNALMEMQSLQKVSLPMCGYIDNKVFSYCSSSSTVYIATEVYPASVGSPGGYAINIESIYTHINNISYFISNTNWSSYSSKFVGVGDPNEYMLSYSNNTVTGITKCLWNSFYNFLGQSSSNILNVSLPNCEWVETGWDDRSPFFNIGGYISTVNLPVLTSVPTKCFMDCVNLTTVSLPLCEIVGSYGFSNCGKLESINLPECVSMDEGAFMGCASISTVDLPKCKYIGDFAFWYGGPSTSINLPVCEYIGFRAFGGIKSSVRISIDLPVCSFIGSEAFMNCYSAITQITLGWSSVCQLGGNPFGYYTYVSSIYVPASLVDAYKSANGWSNYSSKIFPIE